ncbi:XerC/D-like integrase [Haloferax prahovense DSM 18310]|uniref:XerC/D-like integrase n=1 Tax=Haloferax prahovense (strain DSM 18310 / JCM 13924 / TL6) TaxID=1227461 RepID=M0G5K1_HALPT|nr:tyrosine-type recombinase/integrase [Haloferax prahovense]ELZ66079.1 XerC/D-like integrase [Haloferax prahovense DSM 18310]
MTGESREIIYENKHESVNYFIKRKRTMGRSPRTLNEYSRTLKNFFHNTFPEKEPSEITVHDIEEYLFQLDQRELSQNTKRRYLESLSSFYSYTMKRPRFEDVTGNPAAVVLEEIPQLYRDRPDCATWSNGCRIIHEITDPRDKAIATILLKTGCRIREALEIKRDDLMLEDGFIRLQERKGGKQTVVPIDDEVTKAIRRYEIVRPPVDEDYLFLSVRHNRVGPTRIQESIKKAAVAVDIMDEGETRFHKKFTPHTYRTVFTTLMRNEGMKPHILKYIRGDSKQETMDIYTRVDRDEARREYLHCIKPTI